MFLDQTAFKIKPNDLTSEPVNFQCPFVKYQFKIVNIITEGKLKGKNKLCQS